MDKKFVRIVDNLEFLREQAGRLRNRSLCTRIVNSLLRKFRDEHNGRVPEDAGELVLYIMELNDSELSAIPGFGEGAIETINLLQDRITPEEVKASIGVGIREDAVPLRPYVFVVKSTTLYGSFPDDSYLHAYISPFDTVKEIIDYVNAVNKRSESIKYELVGVIRSEVDVNDVEWNKLGW